MYRSKFTALLVWAKVSCASLSVLAYRTWAEERQTPDVHASVIVLITENVVIIFGCSLGRAHHRERLIRVLQSLVQLFSSRLGLPVLANGQV